MQPAPFVPVAERAEEGRCVAPIRAPRRADHRRLDEALAPEESGESPPAINCVV
jgi:hypothetical protein